VKRGAVAVLLLATGCAYFNGVYNARQADRDGQRALASGNDSAAAQSFELAAAAAETVLSRHADSRWGTEALYLAGRGLAFTGRCGPALTRLSMFAARARSREQREGAALATGQCLTLDGRHAEALAVLVPLVESRDDAVARPAARLAARAHLALGDEMSAARVMRVVDAGSSEWLLANAAIAAGDAARAESLLVRRAAAGDLRPAMDSAVRALWRAGDTAAARRITARAIDSRAPTAARSRLRLTVAELLARSGRSQDAAALVAPVAKQLGDSAASVAARDLELRIALAGVRTLEDAEALLRQLRADALPGRVPDAMLLARILARSGGQSGAGAFLAAEVLRDSVGALAAARALFQSMPAASPLAPKGWLAAAAIAGDSASTYVDAARRRWPASPYVLALDGREPSDGSAFAADSVLRTTWERAIVSHRDSLAARAAATTSATQTIRP
jgi:hypothetical protein